MTALKVVGGLIVLFISMLLVNEAFHLLNAPSDMSVAGGVLILLGLLGFYVWATPKVWRSFAKAENTGNIRHLFVLFPLIGAFALTGCGNIPPGHVGIKVNNWGGDRGVQGADIKYDKDGHAILPDNMIIVTGGYFYNPMTSSVFEWPTSVQRAIWSKSPHEGNPQNEEICYNSKEGLVFCADIGFSYHLQAKYVPAFYVKFRSDNMKSFTHGFLRDVARNAMNDAAKMYSTDELYGEKKEEFLLEAQKRVNAKTESYGVLIDNFGYASPARPPEQIVQAINLKLQATQKAMQAENELREARAQAAKLVAAAEGKGKSLTAEAEGQARANALVQASITPALLEWERLKVQREMIGKWNGANSQVQLGGGGGPGVMFNMPIPGK